MRRLSKEFSRDMNKDAAKRSIIPAKWLLEMILVWPGTDSKCTIMADWIIFTNIFVAEIFHIAYAVVHRGDIVTALLISATITTTMEGLVRLYVMISKKDVLNDILYNIWRNFWPLISMTTETSKKLTVKCYITIALTLGCFGPGIFCNLIITLWPYIVENELILKSVFPFRWNQTYIYEVIYIWQYFIHWYLLIIVNVFDNLIVAIMAICVVQFIVLQNVFKNIFTTNSRYHRKILFGTQVSNREIVQKCLDQQRMLIDICQKLESILSIPMLVQFFNSTAAICSSCIVLVYICLLFQIFIQCGLKMELRFDSLKVEPSQFYKMLTYAIAHMFQLFSYCYVGHELTNQSGNMADAIYNCNWETSDDVELKKAVIFMIQRSQKLQNFTAANITQIDLLSYVKVVRLSFSFYTLFNNLIVEKYGG